MSLWNLHDLNELGAKALAGSTRRDVVRIAGDPLRLHPVPSRQRKQQSARSLGVMMAARGGVDVVTDVAAEHLEFRRVADPKPQPTGDREAFDRLGNVHP